MARHLTTQRVGDHLVLQPIGPVVNQYMQARMLEQEMVAAIDEANVKDAIIDMRNVTMLTSVALLPFLGARHHLREKGGDLVLCHMSQLVLEVFTVSQLIVETRNHARYLAMADDIDKAVEWLEAREK